MCPISADEFIWLDFRGRDPFTDAAFTGTTMDTTTTGEFNAYQPDQRRIFRLTAEHGRHVCKLV